MPEYLAPGVYVEETSFRARSIEGVGTSVAGIVGPTRTGPVRGIPEVLTSFAEFERIYGDLEDLKLGSASVINHTALAARAFFDNGGKQLFVSRVVEGIKGTDKLGGGASATAATKSSADGNVTFSSRFPGAMGDYTLEIRWRPAQLRLGLESVPLGDVADGDYVYLECGEVPSAAKGGTGGLANGKFPVDVDMAVAQRKGANLEVIAVKGTFEDGGTQNLTVANLSKKLKIASLPVDKTKVFHVQAKAPVGSTAGVGGLVRLTIPAAEGGVSPVLLHVQDFENPVGDRFGSSQLVGQTDFVATLDSTGRTLTFLKDENSFLNADLEVPVAALAIQEEKPLAVGALAAAQSKVELRNFDLDVFNGEESVYTFADLSMAPSGAGSMVEGMKEHPDAARDAQVQPIWCKLKAGVTSGGQVFAALQSMFDPSAREPDPLDPRGPRLLIALGGGKDGNEPKSVDFAGEEDETKGNCGLAALEDVEDISIVIAPAAAAMAETTHLGVVSAVQKHCYKLRYRVGVVDSRKDMILSAVQQLRNNFDDSRLALYYPWITISNPRSGAGQPPTVDLPPSGFLAGIYARTDVERGVHKSPANVPVFGALRFAQDINRFQQELLNPNGINCLRSFPGRGHRVWGGRTMSSDPEWKYVNVRRYFLFLERSIEKGTQWVVFEPNGEALWANVRTTVDQFLHNEWRNGHLLGDKPEKAYFVRCDRSTMTQNDLDNGRLVCLVGVAPLKPAEFVIFRIGQKTADA